MRCYFAFIICLLLICRAVLADNPSPATNPAPPKSFQMFDNLFENNPDMTAFGIPPITLVPTILYVNGRPDVETARYDARRAAGIRMYPGTNRPFLDSHRQIQFIHPPQNLVIGEENGYDLNTESGRKDMLTIIAAVRDEWASYPSHPEFKQLKLGIFGPIPAGPPNHAQLDDPAALDKWDAQNDAMAPVADALDFVSPVLYMDESDQHHFAAYMSLLIRSNRRLHKPIYAYLWPEYFEQAQDLPTHDIIAKDQWQAVLDEARNEADGVIIWGGEHRFDPNRPWVRITENYPKLKPLSTPPTPTNFKIDPIGLHLSWQGVDPTSRVRVERTLDAGQHWRAITCTDPGATTFDDPEYVTNTTPQYRIQAYNPFASSDYAYSNPIHPARDAFAVNRAIWNDAVHPHPNREFMALANINPGQWVEFRNMAFRQNADHINLFWRAQSNMDIWLDCKINPDNSLDFSHAVKVGSILGRKLNQPNGDPPVIFWQQSASVSVPGGPGVRHDVFLVSTSGDVYVLWAKFGGENDPPAPPRHFAAAGQGGKILLTWFDESDDETGFALERSADLGNTWTRLPDIPPINPPHPDESNAIDSYTLPSNDDALYTWRLSALHGTSAAQNPVTDVASASSKLRPFAVPFKAGAYDRAIAVQGNLQFPDQLYHMTLGAPSTHDSEKIQKYSWVKYSAVNFNDSADRITVNLSTEALFSPDQTITFYLDRLAPDHKLATWSPQWTGTGANYEDQTFAIPTTSGVHDLYMQLDAPMGISIKTFRIEKTAPVPALSAAAAPDPTGVRLSWLDPSDEVGGYIVQLREIIQKPNPTPSDYIQWNSRPVTRSTYSLDLAGLKRNTDYEFRIIARTDSGGRPSVQIKYHTPP